MLGAITFPLHTEDSLKFEINNSNELGRMKNLNKLSIKTYFISFVTDDVVLSLHLPSLPIFVVIAAIIQNLFLGVQFPCG